MEEWELLDDSSVTHKEEEFVFVDASGKEHKALPLPPEYKEGSTFKSELELRTLVYVKVM